MINEFNPVVQNRKKFQLIWGIALFAAGIGVLYRIPVVIQRIEEIGKFSSELFFIKFCFYLMAILLIGGGSKKIYNNYKA